MGVERVTSVEVARRAGVSQSAVSRVFTKGASASPATVEKVRRAAAELGYRPNVLARAMITGRSRIIGLVVAYLDNYFYPAAVEQLSVALQEQGYHLLVFMAAPSVDDVNRVTEEIIDYQVDGLILASVSLSSGLAAQCAGHGIPVVQFNREGQDAALSSVTTDNHAGGQAIARHFLTCGHRRIGYIAGFEGASTQAAREAGFLAGLAEAGVTLHARGVGNFKHEEARAAALEMFAGADRPDAVFVCNDHMAFSVMDVLRGKLGLRVPEDVAVAGFDDVPIAAWAAYDLTSYRQPLEDMVSATVSILMDRIDDSTAPARKVQLTGALIRRGSTLKEAP